MRLGKNIMEIKVQKGWHLANIKPLYLAIRYRLMRNM